MADRAKSGHPRAAEGRMPTSPGKTPPSRQVERARPRGNLPGVAFKNATDAETTHRGHEHGEHLPQTDRLGELHKNAQRGNRQPDELQQSTNIVHGRRLGLRGFPWRRGLLAYHKGHWAMRTIRA